MLRRHWSKVFGRHAAAVLFCPCVQARRDWAGLEGGRGTLWATDPGKTSSSFWVLGGQNVAEVSWGWDTRGGTVLPGSLGMLGPGDGAMECLWCRAAAWVLLQEMLSREPSTSVSSLSAEQRTKRKQQKKCKMHLKILFHFPFRQKQKCLNNRGQKQLLQNFQESGKIKSPLRSVFMSLYPVLPDLGSRRGTPAIPPPLTQTPAQRLRYFRARHLAWLRVPCLF